MYGLANTAGTGKTPGLDGVWRGTTSGMASLTHSVKAGQRTVGATQEEVHERSGGFN